MKISNTVTSVRSSNFELMRLFLILFVIILHFNDTSRQGALSFVQNAPFANKCFLYLLESLCICAVNTFVILSGYFMTRKSNSKIRKVIDLFLTLVLYHFFVQIGSEIYHQDFSIPKIIGSLIPSNYYAWLYSTVFLLAPFLNIIMDKLENNRLDYFIVLLLILFSIIPTIIDSVGAMLDIEVNSMSSISLNGNGRGFTLVNFVLCYYIGGYLSRKDITCQGKTFFGYILSSIVIFGGMFFNRSHALDYCNTFVIIQSIMFFLMFKNLKIKQYKTINVLAKSVWGIFVLHGFFLNLYSKKINVQELTTGGFVQLAVNFLICIIVVFIVTLIIDIFFQFVLKQIHTIIDKIDLVNKSISTK